MRHKVDYLNFQVNKTSMKYKKVSKAIVKPLKMKTTDNEGYKVKI